jgi:hypothetical protein
VADGVMQEAPMEEDDNVAATLLQNNNISRDATLSNCLRDLYILWDEYKHGLQGPKAAKDFNQHERGQVVSTYSKRNHVWQLIRRLVNLRGVHYTVAIDSIYQVYGNIPV